MFYFQRQSFFSNFNPTFCEILVRYRNNKRHSAVGMNDAGIVIHRSASREYSVDEEGFERKIEETFRGNLRMNRITKQQQQQHFR